MLLNDVWRKSKSLMKLPGNPAEQEEAARYLAASNRARLRVVCWAILLGHPLLVLVDFLAMPGFLKGGLFLGLHHTEFIKLAMMAAAIIYLAATRRPARPESYDKRARATQTLVIAVSLGTMGVAISKLPGALPGISPYLVALFLLSAFIRLNGPQSFFVYCTGLAGLLVSLWVWTPASAYWACSTLNGTVLTGMALVVSRIIYLSEIERHINQSQLTEKAEALAKAKQKLTESSNLLRRLSFLDGLTEIPNRRYFDDFLTREWNRAARDEKPISVAMLDVDKFKNYNDTYGHQAGDDCLAKVAQALFNAPKRAGDLVARFGGEEFGVVLPGADKEGALEITERLLLAVEELGLPHRGGPFPMVTVSAGVATARPQSKDAFQPLVKQADEALYQAKQAGRNRVVSAEG